MKPELDPTLADLWLDGIRHRVPPAVVAHFKFMTSLVSNMAESSAKYAERVKALEAEIARRAA